MVGGDLGGLWWGVLEGVWWWGEMVVWCCGGFVYDGSVVCESVLVELEGEYLWSCSFGGGDYGCFICWWGVIIFVVVEC